jgi:hypothetical protein
MIRIHQISTMIRPKRTRHINHHSQARLPHQHDNLDSGHAIDQQKKAFSGALAAALPFLP